jgi:N-acetylmuramoyl-L-alanine amidase
VVFVDAGHGGMTLAGDYTTSGKQAYHPDLTLHDNGYYYEGYENRLVAESFIEKCTAAGIQTIRTYHPYKDTPLSDRVELIKSYLDRGYYGYLHSFHSNAISYRNSKDKLENTIGFMCFTTTKNNHSDIIAWEHIRNVRNQFPDWHYFGGDDPKGDNDIEKDFYIISKSELSTQPKYGAILEEFGFHTSSKDCQFIVDNRESRSLAALKTAIYAQRYFNKI